MSHVHILIATLIAVALAGIGCAHRGEPVEVGEATGALEALFCVQAVRQGILPPTIHYRTPDPACDLDYTPNTARRHPVQVARLDVRDDVAEVIDRDHRAVHLAAGHLGLLDPAGHEFVDGD